MIIIGLTGGIGHGKSTLASYIEACSPVHAHLEASDVISEVANDLLADTSVSVPRSNNIDAINDWILPLPRIIKSRTGAHADIENIKLKSAMVKGKPEYFDKLFAYQQAINLNPELSRPNIRHYTKNDYRTLLQWLGGYLMIVVNEGIWFDELCRRAQAQPAEALVTISGIRFPSDAERVRRAGGVIIDIYRPELESIYSTDLTERQRSSIVPDIQVVSDGTLDNLRACAAVLYNDLSFVDASTKRVYTTTNY